MKSTKAPLLDADSYLDRAERDYLFESKIEFVYPVRRRGDDADFYASLENELREQNLVTVFSYRTVKEGYARISRPASLGVSLTTLLEQRPHLKLVKTELERLDASCSIFDFNVFLRQNGAECLTDLAVTRSCLEILQYLIAHREDVIGLLPRQIPHGQSTKVIGKEGLLLRMFAFWRGEPAHWGHFFDHFGLLDKPAEFRFFAPECLCQGRRLESFHGLIARDWMNDFDFSALRGTLILENFESFYAASRQTKTALVVWGGGWRAAQLRHLLPRFPSPLYYWGDIDKEGYEIFGYLKKAAPDLVPVLMDQATVERYGKLSQKKTVFLGPFQHVEGLQSAYESVCRNGIQIEQEQIHEPWPYGTCLDERSKS